MASRAPASVASGPSVRAAFGWRNWPDQLSSPSGATWSSAPRTLLKADNIAIRQSICKALAGRREFFMPFKLETLHRVVNNLLDTAFRVPFVGHDLLQCHHDELVCRADPIMRRGCAVPAKFADVRRRVPLRDFRADGKAEAETGAKPFF